MKINKEKLQSITKLPDEQMWREIVNMGKCYGFNLPEKTPSKTDLMKLREIVGGGKISMGEAMKLMNDLKRGKNDG